VPWAQGGAFSRNVAFFGLRADVTMRTAPASTVTVNAFDRGVNGFFVFFVLVFFVCFFALYQKHFAS